MNGSSSESGSGHRSRGPAGPEWVRPHAVWFLVCSALSSSLVAGPVGKRETRFLRFPLFHRAVLVSFFFGPPFSFFANNPWFRRFFRSPPKTSHRFARASARMCLVGVWLIGSAIRSSIARSEMPPPHCFPFIQGVCPGWCSAASALQVALPVDMTRDEPGLTRSP